MISELVYMTAFFVFLFGMVIGSFLNVVILRYNTGKSINGRSGCFSCGKKLEWYELVPVFSFLLQGGRCRTCGARLSYQYILVELFTAITFLALFFKNLYLFLDPATFNVGVFNFVFYAVIASLLIVIFVYDLRHKIIPDAFVYAFSVLSVLKIVIDMRANILSQETVWALLAGPLLFLPFYILWKVSGGKWIGLGDGKLALGIGFLFGLSSGFSAIIFSFWIGAIISVFILAVQKRLTTKSEVPFAPFLILSIAIVYFFDVSFQSLQLLIERFLV